MTATRWTLSRHARRTVLTVHIVASVALLGDVAAFLAVAVRAAGMDDPAVAHDLLAMLSVLFGIPLSFVALITGVWLGGASKWGIVRTGWVAAKLGLLVSVILVGALVLGPSTEAGRDGLLIAGSGYDVVALTLATGLSVFKPRQRRKARTASIVSA